MEYELVANIVRIENDQVEETLIVSKGTVGQSSYGSPASGEFEEDGVEYSASSSASSSSSSSSFSISESKSESTWSETIIWWFFLFLEFLAG